MKKIKNMLVKASINLFLFSIVIVIVDSIKIFDIGSLINLKFFFTLSLVILTLFIIKFASDLSVSPK